MTILILGPILWSGAHLFKRVAPAQRAALGATGDKIFGAAILVSIVLMIVGYRGADGAVFWGRGNGLVWLNNLLMIVAFYLYAASAAKGMKIWLGTKVRHPQLTGFSVWAVAHLLVNGDVPSFVLFGGLLIWAQIQRELINRAEGPWVVPPRAPFKKEVVAVVVTFVVMIVVMLIHYALGVTPWL